MPGLCSPRSQECEGALILEPRPLTGEPGCGGEEGRAWPWEGGGGGEEEEVGDAGLGHLPILAALAAAAA